MGQSSGCWAAVIAFEHLGAGLGTAAFTAFTARESSRAFAATQFASFAAFAALPRSIANASTGFIVEDIGWGSVFSALYGVGDTGHAWRWYGLPLRATESLP